MKVFITISRNRAEVNRFCREHLPAISSPQQVGPFFSKRQALSWMQELHARIGNSEIILVPEKREEGDYHRQWYGFTFEEEARQR